MRTARVALALLLAACAPEDGGSAAGGGRGKADTGWVGDTSFEIGADLSGRIVVSNERAATDRALQEQLVDRQLAFGKNAMARAGYHLNQLAERVPTIEVSTAEGKVTLRYAARVDLIREKGADDPVPGLASLSPRTFELKLPLDPEGVHGRAGEKCAEPDGDHSLADYNYYYYFAADKEGCDEPLASATLRLREVYAARAAFPEYDQLLRDLGGERVGMRAAILPNLGDDDPLERFARHQKMIEGELELEGKRSVDGSYVRYALAQGKVELVIDLFDPTRGSFTTSFRKALGEYDLVFYNGHSAYGTQPFLANKDAFSRRYQIVMMHSCRSYPYYARQVFRAKASAEDPTGFALADVVATGESSSPNDSPRTLRPLLEGLFAGLVAVQGGEPEKAPTWLSIVGKMNAATYGIYYGAAGVSSNRWTPGASD
jgi:hypothetical protein